MKNEITYLIENKSLNEDDKLTIFGFEISIKDALLFNKIKLIASFYKIKKSCVFLQKIFISYIKNLGFLEKVLQDIEFTI